MEKIIYIFPGLANKPEHLDNLKLNGKKVVINYPNFDLKDDRELYIQKIAEQIKEEYPIFVSFSLGGVLAERVAQYKKPQLFFLISSAKEGKEISWWIRLLIWLKPQKKMLISLSHIVLIFMNSKIRKIVKDRLQNANQNFLNLLFGFFVSFPKNINTTKLFRIHGKKDWFFPFRKILNPDCVLSGGHFLLDYYPDKLSEIINRELGQKS